MEKQESEVKKFFFCSLRFYVNYRAKRADLKGIWKDKVEFSYDDIREAQLSLGDKLNDLRG